MGDLLLDEELWYDRSFDCPSYNEVFKSCDAQKMSETNRCQFNNCPFVYWLNIINIDK